LEQIRQKYLNGNSSDNIDLAKVESHDRNTFLRYSDRIADLFLQPASALDALPRQPALLENYRDMEAYLASLKLEAQQAIEQILELYEQKARSVDEYILHPNLKDIHFERCCILWIPLKAA
jgi:quinol monooxygenase YgiN